MNCRPPIPLALLALSVSVLSCGRGEATAGQLMEAEIRHFHAEDCTVVLGQIADAESSWITSWFGQPAWSVDAPEILGDTRPAIYASTPSRFSIALSASQEARVLTTAVRRAEQSEDGEIRSEVFWDDELGLQSLGFVRLTAETDTWFDLLVEVPKTAGVLVFSSRLSTPGMATRSSGELAWQRPTLAPKQAATMPDVILLTLDTLRYDAVQNMPYLQSLMAEGMVWEQAYVPTNWTLPSMASLLTGLDPSEHGCGRGPFPAQASGGLAARDFRSLNQVPTIAEAMRNAGYATAALHQNPFMEAWTGLNRGFEIYQRTADRSAANFTPATRWWAQNANRSRFLMLHFMTPHLPNAEVAALDSRDVEDFFALDVSPAKRIAFFDFSAEERDSVRRAYRDAVVELDTELQRLITELRASSPDCRILIYADHGEEHWDAGGFEHGFDFDNSVTHVPLAFLNGTSAKAETIRTKVPAHHLGTYLLEQLQIPNQLPPSALGTSALANRTVQSAFPLYRAPTGGRRWDSQKKAWVDLPFSGLGSPGQDASIDPWTAARLAELGYAGNNTKPLTK